MTYRYLAKLYLLVTLLAMAPVVVAGQFKCPDGTKFKTKSLLPKENVRAEWCESETGLKEGPYRFVREPSGNVIGDFTYRRGKKQGVSHAYHNDGTLRWEIFYENGEEIRLRLSIEELRRILEEKNIEAQKAGKPVQIVVPNEQTLQYNVTVGIPWSWFVPDQRDIFDGLSSRDDVCSLFQLPGTSFESVHVRYIKKNGDLLVEAIIKDSDCRNTKKAD